MVAIEEDDDVFHGDHSFGDHYFEVGEEEFDFVFAVDDFDDDGEIGGEGEDAGAVDLAVGAEAFDAAEDGGTGEAELFGLVEDGFVEGFVLVAIGFADENAEKDAVLVNGHIGAFWNFGEGGEGL